MTGPRIGELFSGYGGLGMGVQAVIGGTVAWHSEIDPGASRILAHRYPQVPNLGDITQIDWTRVEPVEVLVGGFPCQDISSAGKKVGVENGTRSVLWKEMARAVGHIRPSLVVVENVRELAVRGLPRVLGDLAALGYDAQWATLPACIAGAPFSRMRMFITATPTRAHGAGLWRIPERDRHAQQEIPERAQWQRRHADRLALADQRALDRWAVVLGRPAPDPLDWGVNGQPRLTARFSEWLMGLPDGWVCDVPGVTRTDQLKALGNGVVPQQAAAALTWLLNTQEAAA